VWIEFGEGKFQKESESGAMQLRRLFLLCSGLFVAVVDAFVRHLSLVSRRDCSRKAQELRQDIEYVTRDLVSHISRERIEDVISREQLFAMLKEIKENANTGSNKLLFDTTFDKVTNYIREEQRTIGEVIGKNNSDRVLSFIDNVNIDETIVRSILQQPVVESVLSTVLYDAIFEFFQRVDLIGSIINNLPIIGAIRQTIMKEFKKNIDLVLGNQLKSFLASGYNKIAVERMIKYILLPPQMSSIKTANKSLLKIVIARKVNSLLPSNSILEAIKANSWQSVIEAPLDELTPTINSLYDRLADKSIYNILVATDSEGGVYDKLVKLSPSIEKVIQQNVAKYIEVYNTQHK